MALFALTGFRPSQAQDGSVRDDLAPAPPVRKIAGLREWVESGSLRFRIDTLVDCGTVPGPANQLGSRKVPDAGAGPGIAPPIARPAPSRAPVARLAVAVHIIAGAAPIFVSPRDVTLEAGGVILQSIDATSLLGHRCRPALLAQRLGARQSARGLVVFEVSPEFRASPAAMILAYRPTRWGGAGRLEVKLPSCLESCKESP